MSELRILNEETDESQRKKIKLDKEKLIKNTLKINLSEIIKKLVKALKAIAAFVRAIKNHGQH